MRFFLFFLAGLCFHFNTYAQNLDRTIRTLSDNLAERVVAKKKIRLAVADLVNNSGKSDAFTKYVSEQIETNLINSSTGLEVLDRKNLKQLLSDNHLQSEGLIDERTAKSSVSFIKVDGWVLGEITSFGNQFKITIKVIDIETSIIIASATSDFISDDVIQKFQESVDEQNGILKDCQKKSIGDYCFTNSTKNKVLVCVGFSSMIVDYRVILDPGQSQCLYGLKTAVYVYTLHNEYPNAPGSWGLTYSQGQFNIQQCKSQLFYINN